MLLDAAIERFYDPTPGTTPLEEGSPHAPPQKPLLSESNNGHPTNGLALCKNHHYCTMDRDLIAPGQYLVWHIAKGIYSRRSTGEKELADLSGKTLLLPKDPAFHPDEEGLRWRCEGLSAWLQKAS